METTREILGEPEEPFITVQMPESEVYGNPEGDSSIIQTKKKPSWFKRHLDPSQSSNRERLVPVRMRKSEFVKYFQKDQKTNRYREGVIEPPGGRKQWLQERIDVFDAGLLEDRAYELSTDKDYEGLGRKKSSTAKAADKTLDFIGTPYLPWAGKPIT